MWWLFLLTIDEHKDDDCRIRKVLKTHKPGLQLWIQLLHYAHRS
jgi:hypothetical protein